VSDPKRLTRRSLRSVGVTSLLLVAIAALVFAYWAHKARRQREALLWVKSHGGHVVVKAWSEEAEGTIPGLSWLRRLIGDEPFRQVTGVYGLGEQAGEIRPEELENLAALPDLHSLQLNHPGIDDRHMPVIGRMAGLKELDLSGTRISDVGLAKLADLRGLEDLSLVGTALLGPGLRDLAPLRSLKGLDLTSTEVGDEALHYLRALPSLESLALGEAVTDEGLLVLETLPRLNSLSLLGSKITQEGIDRLLARTRIRAVGLHYTPASTEEGLRALESSNPGRKFEASW
jgi:hypothetical protein